MESIKRQWENERKGIDDVRVLREQIESNWAEMERAERAYDLNLVAELKHGKLPKLEAELEALEQMERKDDAILKEEAIGGNCGYSGPMDWCASDKID